MEPHHNQHRLLRDIPSKLNNESKTKHIFSLGLSPRPISICWLNCSHNLHLRPINLVVYKGSSLFIKHTGGIGQGVGAIVVGEARTDADVADEQAIGLHRGQALPGAAAGFVRAGTPGAQGAWPGAEGQTAGGN